MVIRKNSENIGSGHFHKVVEKYSHPHTVSRMCRRESIFEMMCADH